jgi:hypothetical protein
MTWQELYHETVIDLNKQRAELDKERERRIILATWMEAFVENDLTVMDVDDWKRAFATRLKEVQA